MIRITLYTNHRSQHSSYKALFSLVLPGALTTIYGAAINYVGILGRLFIATHPEELAYAMAKCEESLCSAGSFGPWNNSKIRIRMALPATRNTDLNKKL